MQPAPFLLALICACAPDAEPRPSGPNGREAMLDEPDAIAAEFDALYFATAATTRASIEASLEADALSHWRVYGWGQALATMYDATGDAKYALELDRLVDVLLRWRDDRVDPPRIDEHRGTVYPSWAMNDPYVRLRLNSVGAAGLVTAPMAHLYRILAEHPEIAAQSINQPVPLHAALMATLVAFDNHRAGTSATPLDRHYINAPDLAAIDCTRDVVDQPDLCERQRTLAGAALAYNVQFLMGLTIAYVNQVKHAPGHHSRLASLTRHFVATGDLKDIDTDAGIATSFDYASGARPEDAAHVNVDIDFFHALQRYEEEVDYFALMPDDWLQRVGLAVSELASTEDDLGEVLSVYIDGSRKDAVPDRVLRSCRQMMVLSVENEHLAEICGGLMARPGGSSDVGLAYRLAALAGI